MKKSLKNMAQSPADPEMAKGIDEDALNNVKNIIEQNRGRSESDLMGDLIGARRRGELDPQALRDVSGKIMPMLSPEQKQKLLTIMEQLE